MFTITKIKYSKRITKIEFLQRICPTHQALKGIHMFDRGPNHHYFTVKKKHFTYLDNVELFDRLKFGRGISPSPR